MEYYSLNSLSFARSRLLTTEGYRFVYQDQIGSTRRLSNSDMTRDYTPFGETLVASGSNDNKFQYSQKELDSGIGLYYFGARYYNPATGWYPTPQARDSARMSIAAIIR